MRLKLDENFGARCAGLVRAAGHDLTTVADERLCGATDHDLARVCADERRCLITLDLDFANPVRFPPHQYSGLAVLRAPHPISAHGITKTLQTLSLALADDDITGQLWIVEIGRVRIYRPDRE